MTQITMQTPMAIGNLMLIMKDHSNLNQKTTELFVIRLKNIYFRQQLYTNSQKYFQSYVLKDLSLQMPMYGMTNLK